MDTQSSAGVQTYSTSCVSPQICTGTAGEEAAFQLPVQVQTHHQQQDPKRPAAEMALGSSSFWHNIPHFLQKGSGVKKEIQIPAGSAQCLADTPRTSLEPRTELISAPGARKPQVKRLQRILRGSIFFKLYTYKKTTHAAHNGFGLSHQKAFCRRQLRGGSFLWLLAFLWLT